MGRGKGRGAGNMDMCSECCETLGVFSFHRPQSHLAKQNGTVATDEPHLQKSISRAHGESSRGASDTKNDI